MSKQVFTSVSSNGLAVGEYDVVHFQVSCEVGGKSPNDAREKLAKQTKIIADAISFLEEKGMKIDGLRKSPSCFVDHEYDHKLLKYINHGYKASYIISFVSSSVEMSAMIYDTLSALNVENLAIENPVFKAKNIDALQKLALEDAWKKLNEKFAVECGVLNIGRDTLEVSSYQVRYDESERSRGGASGGIRTLASASQSNARGGGGNNDVTELVSGKAHVNVSLTVSFSLK